MTVNRNPNALWQRGGFPAVVRYEPHHGREHERDRAMLSERAQPIQQITMFPDLRVLTQLAQLGDGFCGFA